LTQRGLSVAQWRDYVHGEALRRRHAAELEDIAERCPPDPATLAEALTVWGMCSGAFVRWAETLATRTAGAQAMWQQHDDTAAPPPDPHDLVAVDAAFDRFAATATTPERLEALVASRYLDWLRVDCELALFADLDTAREALLCIRDDGWTLPEATRAAAASLRRRSFRVAEIDPDTRHHFVRARPGDLLGPLELDGSPALARVTGKAAPRVDEDEVRALASRHLVGTAAAREVRDRVEWLHALWAGP
jgi:hypothetical protein